MVDEKEEGSKMKERKEERGGGRGNGKNSLY